MVREILYYPDARLRQKSEPVHTVSSEVRKLAADMTDTMYHYSGVGLAAPQIGVHRRVLVIDVGWLHGEKKIRVLINPSVASKKGTFSYEEGCLSLPGFTAKVTRAAWVMVTATDLDGEPVALEAQEIEAVAVQHEIDHLDGVLFVDRVARSVKDLYRKRLKRWEAEFYGSEEDRSRLLEQKGAML